MDDNSRNYTRANVLKQIVLLPALAAALASGELPAAAADNKKQFKYQEKPGPHNQKCSGCHLFKPPNACTLVTGTISPNGWCTAWVKK
jgi:hypothetical protein